MTYHSLYLSQEEFTLFLNGDQRAFRLVFDMYYRPVYRYVQSLSQHRQEVDDILQQSFIQLFKHKSAIKDPSGIYPYLFTIAKRFTFMAFRRQVIEAKYQDDNRLTAEATCHSSEGQIAFNDLHGLLEHFIEKLPPKQKEIYRLNKLDGYSYEEISLAIGCSKNTVKNHLITASKKIRLMISRHYLIIIIIIFF